MFLCTIHNFHNLTSLIKFSAYFYVSNTFTRSSARLARLANSARVPALRTTVNMDVIGEGVRYGPLDTGLRL